MVAASCAADFTYGNISVSPPSTDPDSEMDTSALRVDAIRDKKYVKRGTAVVYNSTDGDIRVVCITCPKENTRMLEKLRLAAGRSGGEVEVVRKLVAAEHGQQYTYDQGLHAGRDVTLQLRKGTEGYHVWAYPRTDSGMMFGSAFVPERCCAIVDGPLIECRKG